MLTQLTLQVMFLRFLLLSISGVLMYWQTDYVIIFERLEMVNYDKDYLRTAKIKTFKFNRTYTAINFTLDINQAFGNDLKVQVQAYKFASNEYRLFPLRFMFDICDALSNNDFGVQNIYDCGNFTRCPMTKGYFILCNWGPDYSRFPPYIPGGRYKSDLTFIYKSKEFAFMQVYGEVKPKNPWEMK